MDLSIAVPFIAGIAGAIQNLLIKNAVNQSSIINNYSLIAVLWFFMTTALMLYSYKIMDFGKLS